MYYIMNCLSPDKGDLAMLKFKDDNSGNKYRLWNNGEKFLPKPNDPNRKINILKDAFLAPQEPVSVEVVKGYSGIMAEMWLAPVPLMTKRLYEVLKKAGVNTIDTYEAKIIDSSKVYDDYVAFKVTKKLLTETKADGAMLFLLDGLATQVMVHESVKKAILDAGIDTLTFYKSKDLEPIAI